MDIELEELKTNRSSKGYLVEFLTGEDIKINGGFGHCFFVDFKDKKSVRGNHYHEHQHEFYTVIEGKAEVTLVDIKSKKREKIILSDSKFEKLRIGPMVAHAAVSLAPKTILLSYYKYAYDPKNPDTKPYKII